MRACVIRAFGPPEVMRVEKVAVPMPGPGEVLIEVHAVSINRTLDLVVREGRYPRPVALPHVLGVDPSGIVVDVGKGVERPRVGDRVAVSPTLKPATQKDGPILLGLQAWGGYAEFVCVPAKNCHLMPEGLGFGEATVAARHGPVAFNLLRDRANVVPGEIVLVMGAAGGLGSAGVQVARIFGATVIAAAGSGERVAAASALGAEHGIDYRNEDLEAAVKRLTAGRGVDVVFENIGDPDLFAAAVASLARHGRLVTAGAHAGGMVQLDLRQLYLRQLSLIGSTEHTGEDVDLSLRAAADGRLTALIERTLPLSQAPAGHRLVAERKITGKIILDPTDTTVH